MNKNFRALYTSVTVILVIYYSYEYYQIIDLNSGKSIYPFLFGLMMIAGFFCVFLVKALFSGEFKIYDFLELVGFFLLLLIVENAVNNRIMFIILLGVLSIFSIYKLIRISRKELE